MKKISLTQTCLLVAVLIMAIVGLIIFTNIDHFADRYTDNRADEVRNTVVAYVAQCYALEGAYPPDLAYLEARYGLQLDEDKYIYHYEMFATNIFPDVQVFAIEKAGD